MLQTIHSFLFVLFGSGAPRRHIRQNWKDDFG
jgi:hypothetical protein